MVSRLMVVNFSVFVCVNLVYLLMQLLPQGAFDYWDFVHYLSMSGFWREVIFRPWTIITHFFVHVDLFHLLNNLIGLSLFGAVFSDLAGKRRVFPLYVLGGIAGAVFFFFSANLIAGTGHYALGASAAVMALAGASVLLAPEYRVHLLFLGEVKIKYIVLVFVILDLVGLANQVNTGGHIAHLGGLFLGFVFVNRLRAGVDIGIPVNWVMDWLDGRSRGGGGQGKKARRVSIYSNHGNAKRDSTYADRLDRILEKIKAEGYESLTQEERNFLFEASKK
jgi:membrane associated rhomboid family serine protease